MSRRSCPPPSKAGRIGVQSTGAHALYHPSYFTFQIRELNNANQLQLLEKDILEKMKATIMHELTRDALICEIVDRLTAETDEDGTNLDFKEFSQAKNELDMVIREIELLEKSKELLQSENTFLEEAVKVDDLERLEKERRLVENEGESRLAKLDEEINDVDRQLLVVMEKIKAAQHGKRYMPKDNQTKDIVPEKRQSNTEWKPIRRQSGDRNEHCLMGLPPDDHGIDGSGRPATSSVKHRQTESSRPLKKRTLKFANYQDDGMSEVQKMKTRRRSLNVAVLTDPERTSNDKAKTPTARNTAKLKRAQDEVSAKERDECEQPAGRIANSAVELRKRAADNDSLRPPNETEKVVQPSKRKRAVAFDSGVA